MRRWLVLILKSFLTLVIFSCLLLFGILADILPGKEWLKTRFNERLTKPWAVFEPPARPFSLQAEFAPIEGGVRICNRGSSAWKEVLVRITTHYDADYEWLAELKDIKPNACTDTLTSEFYSPDWKRIPAGHGLKVLKVEILASVSGTGYAEGVFE
ncbi:MAG: hypothetical protein HYR58_07985 [Acidobacteria bacterium]|nr:hypothetical protein [Acidobacteriota bacterium]